MITNKEKATYLQGEIDNLIFHISHVNNAIDSPEDYPITEGKPSIDLVAYLQELTNKKNFYQGHLDSIAYTDEE